MRTVGLKVKKPIKASAPKDEQKKASAPKDEQSK